MEKTIIERIFSELDSHSTRLVALSEIVHSNAAILGLVTKLVVSIIIFIVVTSLGAMYNHYTKPDPVLYHRTQPPVEIQRGSHPEPDTSKKGTYM